MPRKASGEFDQMKYQAEWKKQNMVHVSAQYKKEVVLEFREACNKLGLKTSDVIRRAMEETIRQAKENEE